MVSLHDMLTPIEGPARCAAAPRSAAAHRRPGHPVLALPHRRW
jgi:hypothetical protein